MIASGVVLAVVGARLTMPESAGTSLVVVAVLPVPTLVAHGTTGHINWTVAGAFAAGAVPGAAAGSLLAPRLPAER